MFVEMPLPSWIFCLHSVCIDSIVFYPNFYTIPNYQLDPVCWIYTGTIETAYSPNVPVEIKDLIPKGLGK